MQIPRVVWQIAILKVANNYYNKKLNSVSFIDVAKF